MYRVRRLKIGKSSLLDQLALECGRVYSQTLVCFWRTVRHKGLWLKPRHLMRWVNSDMLHAHTADACVQAFFSALKSWRIRRKEDPQAKPPKRLCRYFRIEYKSSAIIHKDGVLRLSNGRNVAPLEIPWSWETPKTVVIRWDGEQYEAIATYVLPNVHPIKAGRAVGIDLGEIHLATTSDGLIVNGRVYRCNCGFVGHRDHVGAVNILSKYLGQVPVAGLMARPTGWRFQAHARVARGFELREAARL
ncbi:MAG: zinc ribbon domain-containing protein [Candidatus Bipolaricaulia bacterium]